MLFSSLTMTLLSLATAVYSTPVDAQSQEAALQGLSIGDIINALGVGLVNNITVDITVSMHSLAVLAWN